MLIWDAVFCNYDKSDKAWLKKGKRDDEKFKRGVESFAEWAEKTYVKNESNNKRR